MSTLRICENTNVSITLEETIYSIYHKRVNILNLFYNIQRFCKQTAKVQIRLHKNVVCSGTSLYAYVTKAHFHLARQLCKEYRKSKDQLIHQ